jgi:hypothetical protein
MPIERLATSNVEQEFLTNSKVYRFVENNFKLNVFQYPSDLGSQDVSHYILFNINVRGKSFFNKSGSGRLGTETSIAQVSRASAIVGATTAMRQPGLVLA